MERRKKDNLDGAVMIRLRLQQKDVERLYRQANAEQRNLSTFARRAILAELEKCEREEKKMTDIKNISTEEK